MLLKARTGGTQEGCCTQMPCVQQFTVHLELRTGLHITQSIIRMSLRIRVTSLRLHTMQVAGWALAKPVGFSFFSQCVRSKASEHLNVKTDVLRGAC